MHDDDIPEELSPPDIPVAHLTARVSECEEDRAAAVIEAFEAALDELLAYGRPYGLTAVYAVSMFDGLTGATYHKSGYQGEFLTALGLSQRLGATMHVNLMRGMAGGE